MLRTWVEVCPDLWGLTVLPWEVWKTAYMGYTLCGYLYLLVADTFL